MDHKDQDQKEEEIEESKLPDATDEQVDRLDSFLSSLQPGVSLLIERIQPSWCSGVLEEVCITDEGIDLEYLIEQWGGKVLSVKMRGKQGRLVGGSYKVNLNSFPPLRYGKPIRQHDRSERFEGNESTIANPPPSRPGGLEQLFAALPAVVPMVQKLLDASESRRQADMAMMMQIMKGNQGGLGDITKVGAVMGQLNEMFRQNSAVSGGQDDDGMGFMNQALDVMKMFMDRPKPVQPPRITRPAVPPPATTPSGKTPGEKKGTVTPLRDVAGFISDMPPIDAAKTITEALGRMTPDKREEAIASFYSLQGEVEGDDDFSGDEEFETGGNRS